MRFIVCYLRFSSRTPISFGPATVMERLLGALACSSRSNGWRACSSHLHRTHWMEGALCDEEAMDV